MCPSDLSGSAPGTFNSLEGQEACASCRPATYQSEGGATACARCEGGNFCVQGSTSPVRTPPLGMHALSRPLGMHADLHGERVRFATASQTQLSLSPPRIGSPGDSSSAPNNSDAPCAPPVGASARGGGCTAAPLTESTHELDFPLCSAACPPGTWASGTDLTVAEQCRDVSAGYWAPTGSRSPEGGAVTLYQPSTNPLPTLYQPSEETPT